MLKQGRENLPAESQDSNGALLPSKPYLPIFNYRVFNSKSLPIHSKILQQVEKSFPFACLQSKKLDMWTGSCSPKHMCGLEKM